MNCRSMMESVLTLVVDILQAMEGRTELAQHGTWLPLSSLLLLVLLLSMRIARVVR